MIQFLKVQEDSRMTEVAQLAEAIWRDYYPALIGMDQTLYMIERFQSFSAIRGQIEQSRLEYRLILRGKERLGYLGWAPRDDHLFLSKLYVLRASRRSGIGARAIAFLRKEASARGLKRISLTVNKGNKIAIAFYRRTGFRLVGPRLQEIGNGYVMDDYAFELTV